MRWSPVSFKISVFVGLLLGLRTFVEEVCLCPGSNLVHCLEKLPCLREIVILNGNLTKAGFFNFSFQVVRLSVGVLPFYLLSGDLLIGGQFAIPVSPYS